MVFRKYKLTFALKISAILFALLANSSNALAAPELPPFDIFGADKQIEKRSQKLMPDICPPLPDDKQPLSAIDVINMSLCHNPSTQASWISLRAQAANLTTTKIGAYIPNPTASANLGKTFTQLNSRSFISQGSSAQIGLSYVLFDFGRREATVEAAEESLSASMLNYDSSLQGAIANTLRLYYNVLSAQGSYEVTKESYRFNGETIKAARTRYDLGLVPLNDLLQAETSYSQAKINLEQSENNLIQARASLATLLGLNPQTVLNLKDIDDSSLASDSLSVKVEDLMEQAKKQRVDLKSSATQLRAARANLRNFERSDLPTFSVSAQQGFNDVDVLNRDTPRSGSIGFSVNIPLFTGFTRPYNVRSARESIKAQELQLEQSKLNVMQDVMRSYQNYKTAEESWLLSWDYMSNATRLRDISLARYKEGIGSMLDVLNAQVQYSSALQQQVNSRYNLLNTRADIVRSIGLLNLNTVTSTQPLDTIREDQ